MSLDDRRKELLNAVSSWDRATADSELAAIEVEVRAGARVGDAQALQAIQQLLNRRWFDLAARFGKAMRDGGARGSAFTRRYAQALIEKGDLSSARAALLEQLSGPPDGEFAELHGLLGRTYKQQYVTRLRAEGERSADLLRKAIEAYQAGYRLNEADNTWHGINVVACLMHAVRHGLALGIALDSAKVTEDVLAYLDARNAVSAWDLATKAEALVARGDLPDARTVLRQYAENGAVTAFNLGSTLRQFEEIWELDGRDDAGPELLLLLRARLIEVEQGSLRLTPDQLREAQTGKAAQQLEAAFGSSKFTALDWFRTAIDRCSSVAKISNETGQHGGTGWLVKGNALVPTWGEAPVLVTNDHVVSKINEKAITPADARVRFEASAYVPPGTVLRVTDVLFNSPQQQLDVSILRLDPPIGGFPGLPLSGNLPVPGRGRVLIIGHPDKGDLAFSIMDNALLAANERLLHYRAPTEGGSSGSPVFNMDWKVIGLHHAGGSAMPRLDGQSGTYEANEGVRMDRIIAASRAAVS